MSTGHEHAVTSLFKSSGDKHWINPTGAHDPYGSYVVRILQPRNTGKIRAGIGTPVTQKSSYFGLKIFHPFPFTF